MLGRELGSVGEHLGVDGEGLDAGRDGGVVLDCLLQGQGGGEEGRQGEGDHLGGAVGPAVEVAGQPHGAPPSLHVATLRLSSPAHLGLCTARAAVPGVAARTCAPRVWLVCSKGGVASRQEECPLCVRDA